MPLSEVTGNAGTVLPAQMVSGPPRLNVGVTFGLTVTVNVAGTAHCPASGVKVYTPEFMLSTVAGLHVPVIPLVDALFRTGTVPPSHTDNVVPKPNVGVRFGLTVTVNVNVVAQIPADGVKV